MRRLLILLICGIGVALLLSGCTASFKSAVREEADGTFTFAYCDQVKGNTVRVAGITRDNEYVYLLKASSPSVTDVPTSIHLGSDFGERLELDDARVRARTGDDHFRFLLTSDALHRRVVYPTIVANAVVDRVIQQSGKVDRRSVSEVTTL